VTTHYKWDGTRWLPADDLDPFKEDGPCWCPANRTLQNMRNIGHTLNCTQARRGWKIDMRRLAEQADERQQMERIGRAATAKMDHAELEALLDG
jgi:hypothetical protein